MTRLIGLMVALCLLAGTTRLGTAASARPRLATPTATATLMPTSTATPVPTATTAATSSGWTTVLDDQFDGTSLASYWTQYNTFYSTHPSTNCAAPSQDIEANGYLTLRMEWKTGICRPWNPVTFTGWWTGGVALTDPIYSSNDQRVTIRWRIVENGVISHRIIPMRWPTGSSLPGDGEQDWCEGGDTSNGSCTTFIHYGGSSNYQLSHVYTIDLTQWHTWRVVQLSGQLRTFIDDMTTPVWSCTASTNPACTSTSLVSTLKHVVLQQECAKASLPCPPQSSGTEDIQIDWITVENPTS